MQALWHAVRRCQTSIIFICSCATSSAASSLRCVSCRCLCLCRRWKGVAHRWHWHLKPTRVIAKFVYFFWFTRLFYLFFSIAVNVNNLAEVFRLSLSLPPSLPNANANTMAATDGFHNSLPFACPMPLHHASVLQLKCQTAYLTWLSLGDIGMQKQTETTTTNETHMQQKPNNLLHKMLVLFSFGI